MRPQVFRVPPADTRSRVEEIALRCDSLWIDTDRAVAVVTWRGLTDIGPSADGVGRIIVSADPQGKKLRWEQVEKRLGDHVAPTLRLGPDGKPVEEEPEEPPPADPLAVRHDTLKGAQPATTGEGAPPSALPDDDAEASLWDAPTNAQARAVDDDRTEERTPPPERAATRPAVEVDVETYARLQLAVERGEVGGMLADLQLTLADLVRIQGGWARRVAASPRLAAELARALEAARAGRGTTGSAGT